MSNKISLVLTIFGNDGNLDAQLDAIAEQSMLPNEIIVINSLKTIDQNKLIKKFKHVLNIKYFFYKSRLMPGGARNLGVKKSKNEIIAFLDSKTTPEPDWLEVAVNKLENSNLKVIFGKTQYKAITYFNELLLLTMYGKRAVSTVPGTIICKKTFNATNGFNENVRAGEDLEWRIRLNELGVSSFEPPEPNLVYSSLSKNLIQEVLRNTRNSWSTAKINAQINTRLLFIGQFLIFILLAAPNWNQYFSGILFIPNITKIVLIFSALVMVIYYLKINISPRKIISTLLILSLIILISIWYFDFEIIKTFFIYIGKVNISIAYLTLLFSGSFIFRAFISPIRLGAVYQDIFPFKWILLGIVGLINDLFKAPGYLLGGFFYLLKLIKRRLQSLKL